MNLLVISCVSLTCGGAERVISILSKEFASRYDAVKIVMWKDAPVFYEIDKRIEVVSIEKEISSCNYVKKIWWFRKFVKKTRPSLVLSFLAKSSIGVLTACLATGQKVVVAERNDPRFLKGGWLMIMIRDFLYTFATGILEQTEMSKSYFTGTKLKKTSVIYNPVFMKLESIGGATKIEKKKKIVSVGRLEPQKNHNLLIDAFVRLHKIHPDYELVIYGEGTCRKSLEEKINKIHLNGFVKLPGNVSNIFDLICDAKLFVMTSNFEGMPNALIEAMCLGLPCVSTEVAGATDLIKDEENGMLVPVGNEERVFFAMKRIIEDDAFAKKIAESASCIYKELSVDVISNQWIEYIDRIVLQKGINV